MLEKLLYTGAVAVLCLHFAVWASIDHHVEDNAAPRHSADCSCD